MLYALSLHKIQNPSQLAVVYLTLCSQLPLSNRLIRSFPTIERYDTHSTFHFPLSISILQTMPVVTRESNVGWDEIAVRIHREIMESEVERGISLKWRERRFDRPPRES